MAHQRQPDVAVARRGLMLVLSSPSGAGKTTLSRRLLDASDKGVSLSVSVTTRKSRPGEKDGRDYRFIDRKHFDAMVDNNELLEMGRGLRQLLWHAGQAGDGCACRRPRRPVRHRLAGHPAAAR